MRKVGDVYLGVTGWSVYDNILDDYLEGKPVPALDTATSIYRFFLDLWQVMHDRYAFVRDQRDDDDFPFGDLDASFIIQCATGIYLVSSNLTVTRFDRYYAIGSGSSYSLGALHALYASDRSASEIAHEAVAAGIAFDSQCGGDVVVETIQISDG
jgi:ATP-dependent protease HslVU (ClpYQ) peptidase subunit